MNDQVEMKGIGKTKSHFRAFLNRSIKYKNSVKS